jgi:tetratricopeptide (TPR) repeat protein
MPKRRKQPPIETSASAAAPARSPLPWLAGAVLALLVFLAYRPAVGGQFIWDDDDYVAQNPTLRSADGLREIWFEPTASPQYYPMVFTTYWLEYRLWGADPRGYHETNVLLHAASAVLLWRILRRLRVPGAYLAAAIFAVHPVMVESVAWITERKNTLSMLFYLASAYAYLRFARVENFAAKTADDQRPHWAWYAAALAFFVLALLSKTVTASLPAALILILWWKRRISARHAALLAPFLALGLLGGLYTGYLEREHVGASGPEWSYTLAQRVLIAGRAVWFYVAKLLVPYKLTFVYPKWPVSAAWQWVFPIAAVALVVALFLLRNRIGRGPLVGVLIFGGTLVPALGFVNVYPMRYTFVADHYQYHASAAFIALGAALLTLAAARLLRRRGNAPLIAGAAIVLVLFILTLRQSSIYKDQRTLWTDTLAKDPNSWMAWTNLGHTARASRPPDRATAADAYRKALALAPNVADTHFNVGQVAVDEDRYDDAIAEFRRAAEIEPRYADAYDMLGFCMRQLHRPDEAATYFRKAIELDPRHWKAIFNLARVQKDQGDLAGAAANFQKTLEINPDQPDAYFHLADCLRRMGKTDPAILVMEELTRIHPENAEAHWSLAALLRSVGRGAEADRERARALSIKPQLNR